ncbi:MAG: hypothetical protein KDB53_20850, partial [Planctomycetes bacterium]|nr:hypothetical protein [Planctomycetota bacterium]
MNTETATAWVGRAWPRVGLLGNPSDGYGGRVLAFSFEDFEARVTLTGSAQETIESEAAPLVRAALRRFEAAVGSHPGPGAVVVSCDIPRQAGLSGSSAIIIATLRAQMARSGRRLSDLELARMALAVEVDDLGITAGPQDRIVQAYEGLLDMDFSQGPFPTPRRLDAATLPPLFLAGSKEPGDDSGSVHRPVR